MYCGHYVEIHQPFFENGITVIFAKPNQGFLISVLDHKNFRICGNLIIENIHCLSITDSIKLNDWINYKHGKNFSLFAKRLPDKLKKFSEGIFPKFKTTQ